MGDVFLEQLVKKKNLPLDYMKKALILLGAVLVFFAGLYACMFISGILAPLFLLISAGGIYFGWYFFTGLNLEYEYIYTNGEIDVDKISAKRKRKRVITVRIASFEDFGEYDSRKTQEQNVARVIDASACRIEPGNYYAIVKDREGKRTLLIFSPGERLLAEINNQYRRHAAFNRAHAQLEENGQ